jgi:hypothetical protein
MFYSSTYNIYIRENVPFQLDGKNYPSNWLLIITPEERESFGLQEVVVTNNREDDRYYWVQEQLDGATLTYINTPKDLTYLKSIATRQINSQAYSLLQSSDYMSIKAFESGTEMDSSWKTWRNQIRTEAKTAKTAIAAATDIPILQAAVNVSWTLDPVQTTIVAAQKEVIDPT